MSGSSLTCPLEPIVVVRTERIASERTPVLAALNRTEHGVVEVFEAYAEGLSGLDGFDYAWPATWLDRPDSPGTPVEIGPPTAGGP